MKAKKYEKRNEILSIFSVITEIEGGRYIFLNERPVHPLYLSGMSLRTLNNRVKSGQFFYAKDLSKKNDR